MSTRVTTLMPLVTVVFTSCALSPAPEVSGPYAASLTREDIRQIAELPYTGSIRRGVHTIYVNRPNEAGVQSGPPQWPKDTIVSFTARKKARHWTIVPGSISTMQLIPTD